MDILPNEIIELIAVTDHKTWLILVRVFKFLSSKVDQEELKKKFLQRRKNYDWKVFYCLPNGDLHNYDEPSIYFLGSQYWYKNNKLHSDNDQPAIIYSGGTQTWYQHGKLIKSEW